jgi:predicted ATP-grasp superfamily ATP-dependent carboligase
MLTNPVIILGDYSNTALSVIRSLSKTGFPLYGIDVTNKRNFSFWSKYLNGYFLTSPDKVTSLVKTINYLSEFHKAKCIILPVTENASLLVDQIKPILSQKHIIFGSKNLSYEVLINKKCMMNLAIRSGFDVPKTLFGNEIRQAYGLRFPVIIKTLNNLKGKRYHILKNFDQLQALDLSQYESLDEIAIQEFISGEEFVVSGCRLQNGKVIIGAIAKKIESWPPGRGESTVISSNWIDGLCEKISHLLLLSEWHGIFDIDLIFDQIMNRMHFLEINYRTGAGFMISTIGGINLPQILIYDVLGLHYHQPETKIPDGISLIQDGLFLNHLKTTDINKMRRYIQLLKKADGYTIYDPCDIMPFYILWLDRGIMKLRKLSNPYFMYKKIVIKLREKFFMEKDFSKCKADSEQKIE